MQFVGKVNDLERMVAAVMLLLLLEVVVVTAIHNICVQMEGPRVMHDGVGR